MDIGLNYNQHYFLCISVKSNKCVYYHYQSKQPLIQKNVFTNMWENKRKRRERYAYRKNDVYDADEQLGYDGNDEYGYV